MYNLRYHIASLVAVFLALSVGLLLGTVVVERGIVSRQRTALVEGLRKDFGEISANSETLKKENSQLLSFSDETAATLTRDVLPDKTVVVVADPNRGDAVTRATEAIEAAGASAAIAQFEGGELGLTDKATAAKVTALLGVKDPKELQAKTAEALVKEWSASGAPRPVTDALVAGKRLTLEGLPATATADGMAVTGVLDGKPDPAQLALAKQYRAAGKPVAGVESTKKATGVAKAFSDAGISAVDDVDRALGKLSLVWVMADRAQGHFGVGEGAEGLYPKPLFRKE